MRVVAGPTVEGVIELELSPTVFVVFDEQNRFADNRHDCFLVLLWEAVQL